MGFTLFAVLWGSIALSVGAGIAIHLIPVVKGGRNWKNWGLSSAICALFSVLLFAIARLTFPSAKIMSQWMTYGYQLVGLSVMAGGGSFGMGVMALLGVLMMIVAWLNQRRRSRTRPH